jgi:hypothetical protein
MARYPVKRRAAEYTPPTAPTVQWLDMREMASVRASSEDPRHTVTQAFLPIAPRGWRAADTGVQVIEVRFRQPRDLTRMRFVFDDAHEERTQQLTISWSSKRGETHGEVIRQQFNFSPTGAVREVEEYAVELHDIERLEIRIVPDISGRPVRASLTECRLA